jgi:tetraacyldisaccharide 4'-kinase
LNILSGLYGRVVEGSRARYAHHPERRRNLRSPVICVGNLTVGGSGKTPVVATLARLLQAAGRRPAVLTRGYKRQSSDDGAVVVSDGVRVLVPTRASGDEAQMLGRTLHGIPVLVCADRHLAGRLAEEKFSADVALLDDGFQHWQLARDVDLLLVSPADLTETLLPFGRLREPLTAARAADALLVPGDAEEVARVAEVLGHPRVFQVVVHYERAVHVGSSNRAVGAPRAAVAMAAIARPQRFFDGAAVAGWDVRRTLSYRDHHWFSAADVKKAVAAASGSGAEVILTTEKDAVRLEGLVGDANPLWAFLPIRVSIEPADRFRDWLLSRVAGR